VVSQRRVAGQAEAGDGGPDAVHLQGVGKEVVELGGAQRTLSRGEGARLDGCPREWFQ
jgi:hypothetical protein